MSEKLDEMCLSIIEEYAVNIERMTKEQTASALKQAILAGDFVRYCTIHPHTQEVVYLPFEQKQALQNQLTLERSITAMFREALEWIERAYATHGERMSHQDFAAKALAKEQEMRK